MSSQANITRSDESTFQSQVVANILERLGPFNFVRPSNLPSSSLLESRPEQIMINNTKFTGEYLRGTNIRTGFGTQVWPDGTTFEGFWLNDKANGTGRMVLSNGNWY